MSHRLTRPRPQSDRLASALARQALVEALSGRRSTPAGRRRSHVVLGFILLSLASVILWFGWEEAVLYSEAVYTRPGDAQFGEFSVSVPVGAQEPYTVLVALHGLGGSGPRERLAMRQ